MSKMIAICGAPGSGKTVTSVKLAQAIYAKTKKPTICVSMDTVVPFMGMLFPHRDAKDVYSIGKALDNVVCYAEDIKKCMVTCKDAKDLGYIGYKTGENRQNYPELLPDIIESFLQELRATAEYIVFDCVSDPYDPIGQKVRLAADVVVRLLTPDAASMGYYYSHEDMFEPVKDRFINVVNEIRPDVLASTEEVRQAYKPVLTVLPCSRNLALQYYSGMLTEPLQDRKYGKSMDKILSEVLK